MNKITSYRDIPKLIQDGSYEVDFGPQSMVKQFHKWESEEGLQIDPDFQRGRVWTEAQQVAYLEFFLSGGKTARVIYLNNPSWHGRPRTEYNDFVIVDGRQRYEAWRRYWAGEIAVYGSYHHEFTDRVRMSTSTMKVNINSLQTRADVLRWYLQFNAGGTPHTPQELDRVRKLLEAADAITPPQQRQST